MNKLFDVPTAARLTDGIVVGVDVFGGGELPAEGGLAHALGPQHHHAVGPTRPTRGPTLRPTLHPTRRPTRRLGGGGGATGGY